MPNKIRNEFIVRILIATAIMGVALWYLASLWDARMREQNLILIQPVVLVMIPFYFATLFFEYRRYAKEMAAFSEAPSTHAAGPRTQEAGFQEVPNASRKQVLFLLLAAWSVAGFYLLGAVPATVLLILGGLLILGVRKPLVLIGTPLITTLILWFVFVKLFGIRIPLFAAFWA